MFVKKNLNVETIASRDLDLKHNACLPSRLKPLQCLDMCKAHGSTMAAMLTANRSVGVAPEVNLRNPLHTSKNHTREGSTMASKPRADITRSPTWEYQSHDKRD